MEDRTVELSGAVGATRSARARGTRSPPPATSTTLFRAESRSARRWTSRVDERNGILYQRWRGLAVSSSGKGGARTRAQTAADHRGLRPTLLDNLGSLRRSDRQVGARDSASRRHRARSQTPSDDGANILPQVSDRASSHPAGSAHHHREVRPRVERMTPPLPTPSRSLIEDDGIGIPDDAQNNLLSHGIAVRCADARAARGVLTARRPARRHDDRGPAHGKGRSGAGRARARLTNFAPAGDHPRSRLASSVRTGGMSPLADCRRRRTR